MNQTITAVWTPVERIIFRLFFTYLVLFFVFVSPPFYDEELFPFFNFLNLPYRFITVPFISWIGKTFFHISFSDYWYGGDNLFAYVTTLTLFILTIIITIIWTFLDRGKAYQSLYRYMHLITRYYLAFALFNYGFNKLSGVQFYPINPSRMLQPFGQLEYRSVLWSFMGASRSYTFISGLMETICGLLLLFRRTSTLGAILTLGVLGNVLMINIGYDVMVKIMLVNYLLIALFVLSYNAKDLFKFFILNRQTTFSYVPSVTQTSKYRYLTYILKIFFIGFIIFTLTKREITAASWILDKPPFYGIYKVEQFYFRNQNLLPLTTDTIRWKNMAINGKEGCYIQFMNDSIKSYKYNLDTLSRILKLTNKYNKCELRYVKPTTVHYLLEGILNSDSVRILMRKFDMDSLPLLKNRGKIKWYQ